MSTNGEPLIPMTVKERAYRLVGDMPWVTQNLSPEKILDLKRQIQTCLEVAVAQALESQRCPKYPDCECGLKAEDSAIPQINRVSCPDCNGCGDYAWPSEDGGSPRMVCPTCNGRGKLPAWPSKAKTQSPEQKPKPVPCQQCYSYECRCWSATDEARAIIGNPEAEKEDDDEPA